EDPAISLCLSARYVLLIEEVGLATCQNRDARGLHLATPYCAKPTRLHDAFTQELVFTGKQILGELITASVGIAARAGKMMIDSRTRGTTKIICDRKDFVARFTLAKQILRVRTGRTHRKKFRG